MTCGCMYKNQKRSDQTRKCVGATKQCVVGKSNVEMEVTRRIRLVRARVHISPLCFNSSSSLSLAR